MSRTLHLTLTKRWFDMILSGEKPEEYREIKPYWVKRLIECNAPQEELGENKRFAENICFDINNGHNASEVIKGYYCTVRNFDYVVFKNGYSKNARTMKFEWKGTTIGKPAFKWYGANTDKDVFVISLGRILEIHNL